MRLNSGIAALCLVLLATGTVSAKEEAKKYAYVQSMFPGYEVTRIEETPVDGLLEVTLGSQIVYMSEDGKYFLTGELYEFESKANLTQASLVAARAVYLERFKTDGAVTFAAEDEKYRVLVFTDIDCPYCRKLLRVLAYNNDRGITIQYLAFPRKGPGTESWSKAEQVWCSATPQEALSQAKGGRDISAGGECADGKDPVARQYKLGKDLGIAGTPAIFTESGEMIVGYRAADELEELLEADEGGG
jgi:thiol:disulfide interchange protein DsbC